MKINLEILSYAFLLAEKEVQNLHTKELVPKMVMRRRLTRGARLVIELQNMVGFEGGRILCGSAYGELAVSANILRAIKENEPISPTDFQNSVYNTAISYLSILSNNQNEILTISSGDDTSKALLKTGAIKALDGDEILLVCFESINIENIEEVNNCIDYLEGGVALKVRVSEKAANIKIQKSQTKGVPNSLSELLYVAQIAEAIDNPIVEVEV